MPTQFNALCSELSLYNAWNIVKEKGSVGGIDGVTIQKLSTMHRMLRPHSVYSGN
jgi:hypothetical protein